VREKKKTLAQTEKLLRVLEKRVFDDLDGRLLAGLDDRRQVGDRLRRTVESFLHKLNLLSEILLGVFSILIDFGNVSLRVAVEGKALLFETRNNTSR
jgi:hypothetical protein